MISSNISHWLAKSLKKPIQRSCPRPKPLLLLILDGWGVRKTRNGNAIAIAKPKTFAFLDQNANKSILKASGLDVGLPAGFQGNSEVGHMNIGAGRIVKEMAVRIDDSIKDGSFYRNKALQSAIENCKKNDSALHIMGLAQDQGVHSLNRHAIAVLRLAKKSNVKEVWLHFFTDGRDSPPKSAGKYVSEILGASGRLGIGRPATLVGRYFAMDRDKRWIRVRKAFDLIVKAKGAPEPSPWAALKNAYSEGQTDEFITPRVFPGYRGLQQNDSVIYFNFRLDRGRELTHALTDKVFTPFKRQGPSIKKIGQAPDIHFVAMTRYYEALKSPVAFENLVIENNLGKVLSDHGLKQLRLAETEKYAHVTYFFNSEVEAKFKGEDRLLIPSPKVATYDLKPEMSARKITSAALKDIKQGGHDVIIMNLANGDMVGHTGKMIATLKAVKVVDECVKKLLFAVEEKGGVVIITGDHGNCEEKTPPYTTSHTLNPVPLYIVFADHRKISLQDGRLADVAPTILKILGIKPPREMTGKALF